MILLLMVKYFPTNSCLVRIKGKTLRQDQLLKKRLTRYVVCNKNIPVPEMHFLLIVWVNVVVDFEVTPNENVFKCQIIEF